MQRSVFHKLFDTKYPVILPVIHVIDQAQTSTNISKLRDAGIKGCFLINHDFDVEAFLPIIRSIRKQCKDFWIGINFLAVTGLKAFPILASLEKQGCKVDAYWGDDARIDERSDHQIEAEAISRTRINCGWSGLYFGGAAFKKQRTVNPKDYATAARLAGQYMDVVTTSGIATGTAAEISKIVKFRSSLPNTPIAIASGITPNNAADYHMADCFMVATGINIDNDFYNIDPKKLKLLMTNCRKMEGKI